MLRLDMRWGMAMAVMVLGMVEDASAELLLETDGIELHGTARVVTYAASLCNVEEASHTEEEYERIKGESWAAAGCLATGFLRLQRVGEMVGSSDRAVWH